MGKLGKRIKRAAKKVGKAVGGPVAASAEAGKAIKQGKGAKGAARAFGNRVRPGASVEQMHEAHVDAASALTEEALGPDAAGRVHDFGRITKPAIPDVRGPERAIQGMGSTFKATVNGDFRRAGRSFSRLATPQAADILVNVAEAGQATGDLFDSPTLRLDEALWPMLRRVFGAGLDYDAIRLKRGRPGPLKDDSATTFPSIIYLGNRQPQAVDSAGNPLTLNLIPEGTVALPDDVLVHELVHAWQNQNGGAAYIPEAVFGYAIHGEPESYRWWNFTDFNRALRLDSRRGAGRHGREWRDMPVEAQAEFIQTAFRVGALDGDSSISTYLQFQLASTSALLESDDQADYAAAFGPGVVVDWTDLLKGAIKTLHRGDFRH